MSRWLRSFSLSAVVTVVFVAACGETEEPTVLQKLDLEEPEGEVGDFEKDKLKNTLMEDNELTDRETITLKQVEDFLKITPYKKSSFLETYQSNGVRASAALLAVGQKYRINPLVLMVYAQATQGLVGERNYPFPPERVEYVFRCGCTSGRTCEPELAGFDRQLECLARRLRSAIDEINGEAGATAAGWAPGETRITLDGETVKPSNVATAVLYDYLPRLNQGREGGNWIIWNIFNHYKAALSYSGPIGGADGVWIGDPCQTRAQCSPDIGDDDYPPTCASSAEYPGGLCTRQCSGECPSFGGKPESFCTKFTDGSAYCMRTCNPGVATSCRDGYECKSARGVGSGDQNNVCLPKGGG